MDKIIIIDDNGIQKELNEFLLTNKQHVRLNSDMDELSLSNNPLLTELIKRYEEKHKVKIRSKDKIRFYKSKYLVRFEAFLDITTLFMADGKQEKINENIDSIEDQLSDFPFIRTHPDHIVNLHFIKRIISHASNAIELINGVMVPVTTERKEIIIETLKKYFN